VQASGQLAYGGQLGRLNKLDLRAFEFFIRVLQFLLCLLAIGDICKEATITIPFIYDD
jgi:hypothetical protein